MTALRYYDVGSASWQTVGGLPGVQGGQGPPGAPAPPTGPAGGDLTGDYPNPGIDKAKIGGLIDYQALYGSNAAYRAIVSGAKFSTNATGSVSLQLNFTPAVDCWWEVEAQVGIMQKADAAYHRGWWKLILTPADEDGESEVWITDVQHTQVQTFGFRQLYNMWRLEAGVAYSCYAMFHQDAGSVGGNWLFNQASEFLSIMGFAWAL